MLVESTATRRLLCSSLLSMTTLLLACSGGNGGNGSKGQKSGADNDDDAPLIEEPPAETVALTSAEAEQEVKQRLSNTLDGLTQTAQSIEASDMGSPATTSMTSVMSGMVSTESECGSVETIDLDLGTTVSDLNDALQEISDALQNEVFRDDLVESDDGMMVVYWMDPAKVCDSSDSECQQQLTDTPVRLRVTQHADGTLRVVLVVDDEMNTPMTMYLRDDSIQLTTDLEETLSVLRRLAGADLDSLPDELTGTLSIALVKHSAQNFSVTLGVLDALSFSDTIPDSSDQVHVALAASERALSVGFDGAANAVSIAADFKALDITMPGSAVCDSDSNCGDKELQGNFNVHLGGLSFGTVVQDGVSELTISDIGLGDTTSSVHLNDDPLVTADINPKDGRRFTMQIQDTAEGALVSFEPKLDVQVAMALSNLSDSMKADLPDWLMDEVFNVTFGGGSKASMLVPDGCTDAEYAFEVTEGTLSLSASSVSDPVVVGAGMCLVGVEAETEDAHPFESIAAGACQ